MSPCSYINDEATTDIRCLLLMKRKNAKEKAADAEARRIAQEEEERAAEEAAAYESSRSSSSASSRNKRRAVRSTRARSKRRAASNVSYAELAGEDVDEDGVENNGDDEDDDEYTDGTSAVAARHSPRSSRRMTTSTSAGSTNSMFGAMAANVASNIASSGINVSRDNGNNKRPKTADGRGYTVAKGIKHGLGFLRPNTKEEVQKARANGGKPVVPSAVPSSAVASAPPPTTDTPHSSSKPAVNYLTHPPANQATCAPAPLQFLDPGELGMSLESSLSQLKDNFAQASAGASTKTCKKTHSGSSTGTGGVKYAPSALTRRFSDANFIGGLLSRDDSLINLAMLPTAEDEAQPLATGGDHQGGNVSSGTAKASASVSTNQNSTVGDGDVTTAESASADGVPFVQQYHFKRDDSLINLAASVDVTQQPGDGDDGVGPSEGGAFGFFP